MYNIGIQLYAYESICVHKGIILPCKINIKFLQFSSGEKMIVGSVAANNKV